MHDMSQPVSNFDAPIAGARIAGVGHADPTLLVENAAIESELGLEPGWIERRTGIRRRRICAPDESTCSLAAQASRRALDHAGIAATELGLIVLATSTPDHPLPPTGPQLTHALGSRAGAIDLAGACTGFVYALSLAEGFCRRQQAPVLVSAANLLSRRIDPSDPGARAIFADGAGSVVLVPSARSAIEGIHLSSDGSQSELIHIPVGGAAQPIDDTYSIEDGNHLLRLRHGPEIFTEAVSGMVLAGEHATANSDRSLSDIDHWVPHQANRRIVERAGSRMGLSAERTVSILADRGNSSAATIPTALSIASGENRFADRDSILLTAVGAGLLQAGLVLRWCTNGG
jgi:3-oxoacyl-[acyl-carrier-protein] synthase III